MNVIKNYMFHLLFFSFLKVSLKDAFTEEFKFVIDFSTYTRELKTSASIYSRSRNSSISIDTLEANSTQNI